MSHDLASAVAMFIEPRLAVVQLLKMYCVAFGSLSLNGAVQEPGHG